MFLSTLRSTLIPSAAQSSITKPVFACASRLPARRRRRRAAQWLPRKAARRSAAPPASFHRKTRMEWRLPAGRRGKWVGEVRPQVLLVGIQGCKCFRGPRCARRDQDIHAGEIGADFVRHYRAGAERGNVVRSAKKSVLEHPSSYRAAEFLRRLLKSLLVIGVGLAN